LILALLAPLMIQAQSVSKQFVIDIPHGNDTTSLYVFLPDEQVATGRAVLDCPGGGYTHLSMQNEGVDWADFFCSRGIAFVVLKYRMPKGDRNIPISDAEGAIRLIRDSAALWHVNPHDVGIMGFSAGGHLTLMGTTSSRHPSYAPVDAIDALSCKPRWAVAFYPAYTLTDDDGLTSGNAHGGNLDTDVLVPEFSFDLDTAPMLLLHGDADAFASMASVKVWEKLRSMGIPAECHTLATRGHCFQWKSSPGTGSYHCFDRVWEYLEPWMY
jgi:acetyl esterase/lipase